MRRWRMLVGLWLMVGCAAFAVAQQRGQDGKPLIVSQSHQEDVKPDKDAEGKAYTAASSQPAQLAYEKEKNVTLSYQLMQTQVQQQQNAMQQQFAVQDKVINDWAAAVRKANGWGDEVQYDREKDVWTKPQPKPASSAEGTNHAPANKTGAK